MNIIIDAAKFAKKAHDGQLRKYTGGDYIIHPARVAQSVILHDNSTEEMVAAAWLHDVVEDCNVSPDIILMNFGYDVYKMVLGLTNKSKGMKQPRWIRKQIDLLYLSEQSIETKIIKLYDRLDNIKDLNKCPDENFKILYSKETLNLLNVIGGVDRNIEQLILKEVSNLTEVRI